MRKITSKALDGVYEVQEYLYPNPIVKSGKVVIVPIQGFLWVGTVMRTEWRGPRDNYEELADRFDALLVKNITIKMTVLTMHEYKLYDLYAGSRSYNNYTDDSVVEFNIWPQYKFVVHYPLDFDVSESKIMHGGSLGVVKVEETLERFKNRKIG